MQLLSGSVALGACLGLVVQAVGQWTEGPYNFAPYDAGQTLATRRVVSDGSGAVLGTLSGLGSGNVWGDDAAELIEVNVTDPNNFHITVTANSGFDIQLFLFRKVTVGGVDILRALLCFDNTSATNNVPQLSNLQGLWNGVSYLHPMTTAMASVGESFTAGRYVIGISHTAADPLAGTGNGTPLFNVPATGLGVRTSSLALSMWGGIGQGRHGNWSLLNWYSGVRHVLADAPADAAFIYGSGSHNFNNASATDTAWVTDQCVDTQRDLWFRLFITDTADGFQVATCNAATDTVVEVYSCGYWSSICNPWDNFVACNDDSQPPPCGTWGASLVDICPLGLGERQYYIRVGTYFVGAGGAGTLQVQANSPPAPSPDLNHDGLVNGADLAILMTGWSGG